MEKSSLEKLTVLQLDKKFSHVMEHEGSGPHLQRPATCPTSLRSVLILSSHLRLGLLSGCFPASLPTKSLYVRHLCPICAICPAHLILLYLITQIIIIILTHDSLISY